MRETAKKAGKILVHEHQGYVELHIEVGFYLAPSASDTGRIIQALSNSFSAISPYGSRQALLVSEVQISSLHAFFKLGNAAYDILEQREILGDFVSRIGVMIADLLGATGGKIPSAVDNFLVQLAKAVNREKASHARIHVRGDNNTIVIIDHENAAAILEALGMQRPKSVSAVRKLYPVPTPPREKAGPFDSPRIDRRKYPENAIAMGTLSQINGNWFVRVDGTGGALLPAVNIPSVVREIPTLSVKGTIRYPKSRGAIETFVITDHPGRRHGG